MSCSVHISFVILYNTAAFKVKFNSLSLLSNGFYAVGWRRSSFYYERVHVEEGGLGVSYKICRKTIFVLVEWEPGDSQVWNRAHLTGSYSLLAVRAYAIMEARIWNLLFHVFCENNVSVYLLTHPQFLQLTLNNGQERARISYEMSG